MATDPNVDLSLRVADRGGYGGVVYAALGDTEVGYLEFAADGFVESVRVRDGFRRRGIATAMFHAMPVAPSFSDQGNSPDGDAWIAAVQRVDGSGQ